jgi:uncharacterized membrane protein
VGPLVAGLLMAVGRMDDWLAVGLVMGLGIVVGLYVAGRRDGDGDGVA